MEDLKKTIFIQRNLQDEKHYREVNLENIDNDKPCVFAFSGNGTTDTKSANGMCKWVENMLGLLFGKDKNKLYESINIYGCKYSVKDDVVSVGEMDYDSRWDFVNNVLLPKVVQNGYLLGLDECKKNMSKMCFATFCWGSQEVNDIFVKFIGKLVNLGMKRNEIEEIVNSCTQISFAPYNWQFVIPTISAVSEKDETAGFSFERIAKEKINGVYIQQDAKNKAIRILSSKFINNPNFKNSLDILDFADEHFLECLGRDNDWNIKLEEIKNSGNAECVSQMLGWAMAKAVDYSIQNYNSKKYVRRDGQLINELNSILQSFDQDQLITKQ